MRFSLYSHQYGGNVLGGNILDSDVLVDWIAGRGDVEIRVDSLADAMKLTEYRIDKLKYHCVSCSPKVNCMFGKPCRFGLPFGRPRLDIYSV